ncbi:MAG TPA: hypothetical protein VM487_25250 [Phycisphaerae bacterium]|nr:hypothetical protein [Phycisphaerae bacterium]
MAWAHQGSSWTEAETNVFPRVKWLRVLLMITPAVVALCAALWHGPFLIDDAYITFRYAENLAAGHGLVFNPGEAVLGTSSPLMAALLGLLRIAGLEVPLAARALGSMSFMGVVLITQVLARRHVGAIGAAALGACLAVHPGLIFAADSGMETGLSMAAVYGTLLLTIQGRYLPAGLLGGIAFLLRPDGVLVLALAIGVGLVRAPRRIWQPLLATAVVTLPWLVYASATYGEIMPHSVAAKQLIHPDAALHILQENLRRLTVDLGMMIICGSAVIGLVIATLRRSELLLVAAWMVLYLAGLSFARIASIFPWYVTPLFPGLILFAGYGVTGLVSTVSARPWAARRLVERGAVPVVLLILAALCLLDNPAWRAAHEAQFGRVRAYLRIAELLRGRCASGDVVLVGEVGALAYALPEQVILDSSGINSPAVFHARKADHERLRAAGIVGPVPEGSPAWVLALVGRFQPRYIVTYRPWLHICPIIENIPAFNREYRRIGADLPGLGNYFILERVEAN